MTEVLCLGQVAGMCKHLQKRTGNRTRSQCANVKLSTATSKALHAKHLEQTGGDMTVYNSSASASVATIDVKSLGVTTSHATKKNILSVFRFLYQTQTELLYLVYTTQRLSSDKVLSSVDFFPKAEK